MPTRLREALCASVSRQYAVRPYLPTVEPDNDTGAPPREQAAVTLRNCNRRETSALGGLVGFIGGRELTTRQRRALLKTRPDVESWATFLAHGQIRRAPTGT